MPRDQTSGLRNVPVQGDCPPKSRARFEEPQSPQPRFVPPADKDYFQPDGRRGSDGRSPRSRARDCSPSSRSSSRSPSPRSRDTSRPRTFARDDQKNRSPSRTPSPRRPRSSEEKAWYKKKTLWATVGTIAAIAALVPASVSANASTTSAKASQDAAAASRKAARASRRSANAVEASANAVINTSIANGHQDVYGRYTGPGTYFDGGSVQSGSSARSVRPRVLEYDMERRGSRRW